MENDTLLGYLKSEFGKEIETRSAWLASGGAPTYEEYKYVAGVIRGLALATETITDLVQRLENSDE